MATFEARREHQVLHLRFGAPDRHNLMSDAWFGDFESALRGAAADAAVRCVCLAAVGKSFSAGADLEFFLKGPWPQGALNSQLARCLELLEGFEKPIVAAVHGSAIGGGTTVLLHCDFVYAAPGTKFQLPFTRLGIVPELGSTFLLPRFAGQRLATELLLLGRAFDVATAVRAGIVNEEVPAEQLLQRAGDTAAALAALPPQSLRLTKRLVKQAAGGDYPTAWRRECEGLQATIGGAEMREACHAFLEKREPDFSRFA
ncbi:MAG TPA: enoyl-CoA hydratase-related protein [Burkholderiaceae bacterium]|nr:enoyl-CoA hydratase-related protein [Burkholderiaceae bacterium]